MIIDLNPSKKEIRNAERCLEKMKSSSDYDEYEANWRNCLNHIEKCFEKIRIATKPIEGKFSSKLSLELMAIKTDSLLCYLKQARNADNHSIQDISKLIPGGMEMTSMLSGGSHYIKQLTINNGVLTHYEGDPVKITFTPTTIEVTEIINRGSKYSPPNSHLGKTFSSKNPIDLARKGIEFYSEVINKTEKELLN